MNKKTVPKKQVKRSASAKKTVSKKATVKKSSPKKVSSKKKVTKVSKDKKVVTSKNSKIQRSIVVRDKATVAASKKTYKKQVVAVVESDKKSEKKLLIPSPFRFPIDSKNLAKQTARFMGLFLVVAGAICTLIFNNLAFSSLDISLSASTMQSSDSSAETESADTSPDAEFFLGQTSPLSGRVEIKVSVPIATKVTLSAYNKTTKQNISIGAMTKNGETVWVLTYDTTKNPDGDYVFKALIENQYTRYEQLDVNSYTIENDTSSEVDGGEDSGDTNTAADSIISNTVDSVVSTDEAVIKDVVETVEVAPEPVTTKDARIELANDNPIHGTERVFIYVSNANRVKLVVTSEKDKTTQTLGYAYQNAATEWRYSLDTTKVPNGTYLLHAVIVNSTSNYVTEKIKVEVNNSSETTVIEPIVETVTPGEIEEVAQPEIRVEIKASSPLSGVVPVQIKADNVSYVELYATQKTGGLPKYLGMATQSDTDVWTFSWDTIKLPNAEYKITAKVRTKYGIYESSTGFVKIANQTTQTYTTEQKEKIEVLTKVGAEIENSEEPEDPKLQVDKLVLEKVVTQTTTQEDEKNETLYQSLIADYKESLDKELQNLSAAIRSKDQSAIDRIKRRINAIKQEILDSTLTNNDRETLLALINKNIDATITRVENDVEKTNILIAERTNKASETDSDNDGITDYDEVNLYKTDPFNADSDNDGYIDGAEVLGGFDPTDSTPQVAVSFESPKDVGVVREDILTVESVTTAALTEDEKLAGVAPKAIISGKALPNSYVTLYIFSTPVIVTIKTESDGSWQYRFDKELDDGEHEVYVGVTDNAGKIVAKSNPLSFIKTAEAYTPTDTALAGSVVTDSQSSSFFSTYFVYLLLSISVVAIGLVLILLGLHLEARPRRKNELFNEEAPAL